MEKKPLIRKWLAVGIILLFIGIAYAPAMAQNTEKPLSISRGTWLYVGGSGPGNYSRIQDAINDSSNGDTIYVYSGIYYERIIIRTAIHLIGESRNTTVIDAITAEEGTLISLYSTNITITGFTLRFNGDFGSERSIILNHLYHAHAENVTISDNIFQTNMSIGIHLLYGYNCRIINNIITTSETGYGWGGIRFSSIDHSIIANNSILSNSFGCELHHSNFNTISNNDFYDTMTAISLTGSSDNNSIQANKIDNPITIYLFLNKGTGISFSSEASYDNYHNIITGNSITHCMFGIYLEESQDTTISQNTFLKNLVHARFHNTGFFSNHWDQNYWGRPQTIPKPIFGIKDIHSFYPGFVEFDWHPAQEPYDIPRMS